MSGMLAQEGVWHRHLTVVLVPEVLLSVGRTGRYVRIQLAGTDYLHMAEVKVLGTLSTHEQ